MHFYSCISCRVINVENGDFRAPLHMAPSRIFGVHCLGRDYHLGSVPELMRFLFEGTRGSLPKPFYLHALNIRAGINDVCMSSPIPIGSIF